MKARLLVACCWALFVVACNSETPPALPGSFDRPTRVAFACFNLDNVDDPRPVALEQCSPRPLTDAQRRAAPIVVLHALVLQSSRGEVAAVDLVKARTLDSREDIPGYTFVAVGELPTAIVAPPNHPELTYVANAGSRDISVVSTRAFRKRSARDETTRQTVKLPGDTRNAPLDMVLSPAEDALFVSLPDAGRVLRLPIQRCSEQDDAPEPSDAGPADAGDAGLSDAASDDAGDAAPTSCVEGLIDASAITEIDIGQSSQRAAPVTGDFPATEPYARQCSYKLPETQALESEPTLPPDVAQITPKPSGLALDAFCPRDEACVQRLLVADAALPLIHVIDVAALSQGKTSEAILAPIVTGAPTRTVAVTPRVPVSTNPDDGETQYVYAVDANDGSVLVTQNGRLLAVGTAGARRDRATLGSSRSTSVPVATSLSVFTPAFDVHGPAGQYTQLPPDSRRLPDPGDGNFCIDTLHTERTDRRLRGVFMAVGLSDGSLRVLDVHDMDIPQCRGLDASGCEADPYPLVRHRTRIVGTGLDEGEVLNLAPIATPQFAIGTDAIPVRVNGTTSDPRVAGLGCVPCTGGQEEAFPDKQTAAQLADAGASPGADDDDAGTDSGVGVTDTCGSGEARVCSLADPWAELDQWGAIYEGVIPGSRGGQGRFAEASSELNQTGKLEFIGEPHFCSLGVLGSTDIGDRRAGDQLTIAGPLPTREAIERAEPTEDVGDDFIDNCKALIKARDEDDTPIAFPITDAYDDRLVIGSRLINVPQGIDRIWTNRQVELVNKCFGNMLMTFEVRARSGYVVLGQNAAGFVHRVKRDDSGRCVIDATQDPRRTGRAYPDATFDNGRITFKIKPTRVEVDTRLVVDLTSTTPKAIMDATSSGGSRFAVVPSDLRWSEADGRLYLVDVAGRGLIPIPVDPFPTGVTDSFR